MVLKNGFTLIEFLMTMAIVVVMSIIMISAFNPSLQVNKAGDATRKKDIRRIGIAFEEYMNDMDCYPTQAAVSGYSCGATTPLLPNWPCDPAGFQYIYQMDSSACPRYYRIFTKLRNRVDKDIPTGWYSQPLSNRFGDGSLTRDDMNYGVSSMNVGWNDLAP